MLSNDQRNLGIWTTIYELLDMIRERPQLYFEVKQLSSLAGFLAGVRMAISGFRIHLAAESPVFGGFSFFVAERFGELRSMSWRGILLDATNGDEQKAYELFFELLDEYRARGIDAASPGGVIPRPIGGAPEPRRRLFDVFNLLDDIRSRPALYLPTKSVTALRTFMVHFMDCTKMLEHAFETRTNLFRRFNVYVGDRLGAEDSTDSWDLVILASVQQDEEAAFDRFFELLDDFRDEFLIGTRIEA